jgi:hypothetical protein
VPLSADARATVNHIASLLERAARVLRGEPMFDRGMKEHDVFIAVAHDLVSGRTSVLVTAPYRITPQELSRSCHELMHAGLVNATPNGGQPAPGHVT